MVAEQPDQAQVEHYDAIVIGAGISGLRSTACASWA